MITLHLKGRKSFRSSVLILILLMMEVVIGFFCLIFQGIFFNFFWIKTYINLKTQRAKQNSQHLLSYLSQTKALCCSRFYLWGLNALFCSTKGAPYLSVGGDLSPVSCKGQSLAKMMSHVFLNLVVIKPLKKIFFFSPKSVSVLCGYSQENISCL